MSQFVLQPLGPYSLRASATFLEGFAPAAYNGSEIADHLHFAFIADGSEQSAGVCLRGLSPEQALEHLKTLPGIGDFSAQLILLRGAGEPDALPTHEPRLARAMTMAYGLDHLPTTQKARQIAEVWRPYRTWGSLLLRVMLEEETQEIARGKERR